MAAQNALDSLCNGATDDKFPFTIDFDKAPIRKIYEKLRELLGLPACHPSSHEYQNYFLLYDGKRLDLNDTLAQYGVRCSSFPSVDLKLMVLQMTE